MKPNEEKQKIGGGAGLLEREQKGNCNNYASAGRSSAGDAPSPIPNSATSGPTGQRKRLRRRSKPQEMPSRPLSAYNLFFKEARVLWLAEKDQVAAIEEDAAAADAEASIQLNPDGSRKRKKSRLFEKMAKEIGKRWKKLAPNQRKKYQELAEQDKERYRQEMLLYHEALVVGSSEAAAAMPLPAKKVPKKEAAAKTDDEEEDKKPSAKSSPSSSVNSNLEEEGVPQQHQPQALVSSTETRTTTSQPGTSTNTSGSSGLNSNGSGQSSSQEEGTRTSGHSSQEEECTSSSRNTSASPSEQPSEAHLLQLQQMMSALEGQRRRNDALQQPQQINWQPQQPLQQHSQQITVQQLLSLSQIIGLGGALQIASLLPQGGGQQQQAVAPLPSFSNETANLQGFIQEQQRLAAGGLSFGQQAPTAIAASQHRPAPAAAAPNVATTLAHQLVSLLQAPQQQQQPLQQIRDLSSVADPSSSYPTFGRAGQQQLQQQQLGTDPSSDILRMLLLQDQQRRSSAASLNPTAAAFSGQATQQQARSDPTGSAGTGISQVDLVALLSVLAQQQQQQGSSNPSQKQPLPQNPPPQPPPP